MPTSDDIEKCRSYDFAYNRRPEVRARKKAYNAARRKIPEVLAREKLRDSSDKRKLEKRLYYSSDQSKKRSRDYWSRPENVARKKARLSSPEGRARQRLHYRRQRARAVAVTKNECRYCGVKVSLLIPKGQPGHGQIDHIIPKAKGGKNTKSNRQLLCFICNWMKRDLYESEFLSHIRKIAVINP